MGTPFNRESNLQRICILKKDFIFVTTGTQFPFDRLVSQVDKWAEEKHDLEIVAQTAKSEISFNNIKTFDFLSPQEYSNYINKACLIIGHAGMGTIITGFEQKKPLILMARKFEYGEHRNDHQQSTVNKFVNTKGIYIANNEDELLSLLRNYKSLDYAEESNTENRKQLIRFLSNEVKGK